MTDRSGNIELTLKEKTILVKNAIQNGTVFTPEIYALGTDALRVVFTSLNTDNVPLVLIILEEPMDDDLKQKFINDVVSRDYSQLKWVPPEFQDPEIVMDFAYWLKNDRTISAKDAFHSIAPNQWSDDVVRMVLMHRPMAFEYFPDEMKTEASTKHFLAGALKAMMPATIGHDEAFLKLIPERFLTEEVILKLVEKNPGLFMSIPGDKLSKDVFITVCKIRPTYIPELKSMASREIFSAGMRDYLEYIGLPTSPSDVLLGLTRYRQPFSRGMLQLYMESKGPEEFLPFVSTAKQAINMALVFGAEALPSDMKYIKAAKRKAVSEDLGL